MLGWPLESALVFGALIGATEPIAVIALLKESGVTARFSLLIGSAMATIDFAREGLFALALVIALALLGRAAAVYPVSLAFARTRWAIPINQQHLMWWGGLRGALALALALALAADLPLRDDILISAFAVVAFSVIVQGLTAPLALKALRVAPKRPRADFAG